MIIEISEHGSVLKRNHDCFVIKNSSGKVEVPAEKARAVIVTANALISTQAISLCIEKGIELVLAEWSGKPFGRLWACSPGKATELRRKQYLNQDSVVAFNFSKEIVAKKLREQKRFLVELKNNRSSGDNALIDRAIRLLQSNISSLKKIEFSCSFKQELLGIEGVAASFYFSAISSVLPNKYKFTERSRRPAGDPFNAVLNYAYGLTYANVEKVVILSGLDPNAGFYHADTYGKPTLVFDLIEVFRARVDRIAVKLFTKRIVRESWFQILDHNGNSGVLLSKDARKNIIKEYVNNVSSIVEKEGWQYCKKLIDMLFCEG
ncbi:MAG: CRISPR-associated endonuclease Cas1 [Candidatus Bathyarchaeia archaeon]